MFGAAPPPAALELGHRAACLVRGRIRARRARVAGRPAAIGRRIRVVLLA
jgi:hypothetical protein